MAARFWVGGSGTWDASDTTHWASSSGGVGGASVPTSADNVAFDSLSNATDYTCTIGGTTNCANLTMGAPLTGKITWAGSSAMSIYGSLSLTGGTAGITRSYTGAITFRATTSGHTLSLNGITLLSSTVTFNGVGGGWTLSDTWNSSSMTFTNGTFNTGNQTVAGSGVVSLGSGTKSIVMGSTTWAVLRWNFSSNTSGLTFDAGTSTINNSAGNFFDGGGQTYNVVTVSTDTSNIDVTGSNTFTTLTITGGASKTSSITFSDDQTVTGTLTINGNSSTNRILVRSSEAGTPRTYSAGTVTVTNADFKDAVGAGAGSWNLSAITGLSGDCGGNSGITFTTAQTNYWIGGTGNWSTAGEWSTSSGGAANGRVPLPQDDAVFDANSFSAGSLTVTQDMPRAGKNINWTGVTNTPTWTTSTTASVFGSLTLVAGMTLTGSSQTYTFEGRSAHTLTNAGHSWGKIIKLEAPAGTLTFQDTFSSSSSLQLFQGTLSFNNQTVTSSSLSLDASFGNRTLTLGSGTTTLTGTGTIWNVGTQGSTTISATTGTIVSTDTSSSSVTFTGGGRTYSNLWFNRGTSTGSITISGSNTFNEFKDTGTVAHSIIFTAGTTQTVSTFTVRGTAGNVITLDSTSSTNFTLSKSSGVVACDYLAISDSTVTGGATWYAGAHSSDDGGGNSGWLFTSAIFPFTLDVLAYTLTLQTANLLAGYRVVLDVGSYVLSFIDTTLRFSGWTNLTKNAATFTNQSKNSSTWTNVTKS